jgi:hypothetical protein
MKIGVHCFNPLPPCEIIFPKQGDLLVHNSPTYNLLVCHFPPEVEQLLDENTRQYSVVLNIMTLDLSSMKYVMSHQLSPVLLSSPASEEHLKLTTISAFHMEGIGLEKEIRYKFVYDIFVGTIQVDQVSTIVTYMSNDFFRKKLGLQPINLINTEEMCREEGDGKYCPLLEEVVNEVFTESFDFIEIGMCLS